jgi:hypothetical protein
VCILVRTILTVLSATNSNRRSCACSPTYFERSLLATWNCRTENLLAAKYIKSTVPPSHLRMVRRVVLSSYAIIHLDFDANKPCPLADMVSLEQVDVRWIPRWISPGSQSLVRGAGFFKGVDGIAEAGGHPLENRW